MSSKFKFPKTALLVTELFSVSRRARAVDRRAGTGGLKRADEKLRTMAEHESNKAHAFAAFAETHQWDVKVRGITHRDYPRQSLSAGWVDRDRSARRRRGHCDLD
jgi:hypothetical protein